MKKEATSVEMDLKKIFLTPPNTLFVMFFGPVCFTDVHPAKAVLLSCLPCPSPGAGSSCCGPCSANPSSAAESLFNISRYAE